jgi:threonine synthase
VRYVSTRGGIEGRNASSTFTSILLEGLAQDGGLFLPESYPVVLSPELKAMREMTYPQLAFALLSKFADDIPADDLRAMVDRTYTREIFRSADVTPLKTLEPGLHILGLSNGPTLAFKDLAMQLIGNLFEYALAKNNAQLNILGATSGDTGSAAEYAMRGKKGIRVFMLSPHGRMSPFQTAQMFSLQDPNIFNLAVKGVFDDCQDIVKAVSGDAAFKSRHRIGTVNSINWARVAAQVVYYFKGYFAATKSNDEVVTFAVPSGNFGNIYAGHIARSMGLPIKRLILATNENDVLDEFFRTGKYRVRKASEVHATSSPSMDISKASNFERYVCDILQRDTSRLKGLWAGLEATGAFDLSGEKFRDMIAATGFSSGSSTHADRISTIRGIHEDHGVIVDTHTADGIKVGLQYREVGVPLICLETAQPAKFSETIHEALGRDPERPAGYEDIEALPQRFEVIEADAAKVKAYIAART